jgi:hypothetical protein
LNSVLTIISPGDAYSNVVLAFLFLQVLLATEQATLDFRWSYGYTGKSVALLSVSGNADLQTRNVNVNAGEDISVEG